MKPPIDPQRISEYDASAPPRSTSAAAAQLRHGLADAIATYSEAGATAAPTENHVGAAALRRIAAEIATAP